MNQEKRVCVILHLYYQNMWTEIKGYLKNLEKSVSKFDLFVTHSKENKNLFDEIKTSFKDGVNVKTMQVENLKGGDIYPFIKVLDEINLEDYDFIYKLHTKQDINFDFKMNGIFLHGSLWRNFMFNEILGWGKVKSALNKFQKNKKLGIYGFAPLLFSVPNNEYNFFPSVEYLFKDYGEKLNLQRLNSYKFYGGIIFLIRSEILKPLQNVFNENDFIEGKKFSKATYAIEALFGYIVKSQNYLYDNENPFYFKILKFLSHKNKFARFLYRLYVNLFIFKRKVL